MAQSIKVPKEVMEVFYESAALTALAAHYDGGFFPSLKAVFYAQKATKARALAWRALHAAHPATMTGEWHVDVASGMAQKAADAPDEVKPKKTRKPRTPKAAPEATNQGESK